MRFGWLQITLAIVLAALAGAIGAYLAGGWMSDSHHTGMHGFVHQELNLTSDQSARLDEIEVHFSDERRALDLSMRAANARLAAAIEEEHEYGPKVSAAIDDVHTHMGEQQKATVRHVFAMRALLDDEQRASFDRQVVESLTSNPRE